MASCCELLGVRFLYSCNCPRRSGHVHIGLVNLQKDKCCSLFCDFLSLYEWTLKCQSPKNRLSCIFQAISNIIFQRCRVSMTKHRQQGTKIKVKGRDLIWIQISFSLLHMQGLSRRVHILHISFRRRMWIKNSSEKMPAKY